jgi:hypothetical protein
MVTALLAAEKMQAYQENKLDLRPYGSDYNADIIWDPKQSSQADSHIKWFVSADVS